MSATGDLVGVAAKLRRARTHLLPYTHPHPEVAVASAITPSGGMLAGRLGLGMLCVAATETAYGGVAGGDDDPFVAGKEGFAMDGPWEGARGPAGGF